MIGCTIFVYICVGYYENVLITKNLAWSGVCLRWENFAESDEEVEQTERPEEGQCRRPLTRKNRRLDAIVPLPPIALQAPHSSPSRRRQRRHKGSDTTLTSEPTTYFIRALSYPNQPPIASYTPIYTPYSLRTVSQLNLLCYCC